MGTGKILSVRNSVVDPYTFQILILYCILYIFCYATQEFAKSTKNEFAELVKDVEIIHDFEMVPGTRRPKVLVQTGAHISGCVLQSLTPMARDVCPCVRRGEPPFFSDYNSSRVGVGCMSDVRPPFFGQRPQRDDVL